MILTSTLPTPTDERTALDSTAACIDDDRLALTKVRGVNAAPTTTPIGGRHRWADLVEVRR